ncbi:MAG: hypothetical protein KGI59_03095 [Patescibacteria group bacterium]|nr:hypothetical protein [Patescibacteria group bacterium]MDE2172607.1 hypothetical protein [Patescibacteria group bacterium]
MNTRVIWRIVLDLLLVLAAIQGWWPAIIIVGLIGVWTCRYFVEFVGAAYMYDMLFNVFPAAPHWAYLATATAIVVFAVEIGLKKIVRD